MKKALLVISFGTSYPDTCEKNIVACEQRLAAARAAVDAAAREIARKQVSRLASW